MIDGDTIMYEHEYLKTPNPTLLHPHKQARYQIQNAELIMDTRLSTLRMASGPNPIQPYLFEYYQQYSSVGDNSEIRGLMTRGSQTTSKYPL